MQTTTTQTTTDRNSLVTCFWRELHKAFPKVDRTIIGERLLRGIEHFESGRVGVCNFSTDCRVVWTVRPDVKGPGRNVASVVDVSSWRCDCVDAFWRAQDSRFLCEHAIACWIAELLAPKPAPAAEVSTAHHADLLTCARCGDALLNRAGLGWVHLENDEQCDHAGVIAFACAA